MKIEIQKIKVKLEIKSNILKLFFFIYGYVYGFFKECLVKKNNNKIR